MSVVAYGSFRRVPMKSRRRLGGDVIITFVTQAGLVYDIFETHCLAQNGRTHRGVFATFQR